MSPDDRPDYAPLDYLDCPASVRSELRHYLARAAEGLADGDAIWLYGSLARGCYHAVTSDVDVLVVVREECSEETLCALTVAHREAQLPLDVTIATRAQAAWDTIPTRVELLLKPTGGVHRASDCGDFLLQRQDAWECNLPVLGPSPRDLLPPVPWPALALCLDALLPHLVPRFQNATLMLCRALFAFSHRRLCGKREAGEWARSALDTSWRPLIEEALAQFEQGRPEGVPPDRLHAFETLCRERIATELAAARAQPSTPP